MQQINTFFIIKKIGMYITCMICSISNLYGLNTFILYIDLSHDYVQENPKMTEKI